MTSSLISEDFPQLSGRQLPHDESILEGSIELGEKAIELARRAGTKSMPWQVRAQHAILSTAPDGTWTHPDCCLIVPRQNGKSEILILRCLFGLFKLGERIVYTAQRWRTAEDAYKRLLEIIESRPSLKNRVVKKTCSQGQAVIKLASGAEITFCTRSNDSGRGLTVIDLIIYDEAYNLTDGEIAALSFTQMASLNPQTIYASSAVNQEQHANGHVLAGIRRLGLAKGEGLYFAEYMAPEEMPRTDEATWQYANPSYGVVQTAAKVRKIMRGMNTSAGRKSFDVEALGRGDWPKDEDDVEGVIPAGVWKSMENSSPTLRGPIALALDMTPDRKWLSIGAAQRTDEDRIHVEVGFHSAPTPQIIAIIAKLIARWDPCALIIDRQSPAMSLVPDLLNADIEAETTTATQMVQACGGFYDDAIAQLLDHTGDPLLEEALAGATQRELPGGGWAWKRTGPTPIAPLVAVSLAHYGLVTYGTKVAVVQKLAYVKTAPVARNVSTGDLATAGF